MDIFIHSRIEMLPRLFASASAHRPWWRISMSRRAAVGGRTFKGQFLPILNSDHSPARRSMGSDPRLYSLVGGQVRNCTPLSNNIITHDFAIPLGFVFEREHQT